MGCNGSLDYDKLGRQVLDASPQLGNLDVIWRHPTSGAALYVGSASAAHSRPLLKASSIHNVVVCLEKFGPNCLHQESGIRYLHFPISQWSRLPKTESPEGVAQLMCPLFGWVFDALSEKRGVLIHCLAGAHRAGTAGIACLMQFASLDAGAATNKAQAARSCIEPIFDFRQLLSLLESLCVQPGTVKVQSDMEPAQVEETAAGDDSMDPEAIIAAFLADPTRKALELPGLTAGQRKEVKKLADQHPQLKCESYGLGADRQLHIFKRSSSKEHASANVSVKNTFIDDWVASEGGRDEIVFRSMPPQLGKQQFEGLATSESISKADLSPIIERPSPDQLAGHSASASSAVEPEKYSSSGTFGTLTNERDLPGLPSGYKVINTFVHIEGDGAPSADERVVQSMPHGMFSQCMSDELAKKQRDDRSAAPADCSAVIAPPSATPVIAENPASLDLTPGMQVVIEGLKNAPDFNGLTGVVQSWDETSGRYDILLTSPSGGRKWAKVKRENLRLALPPPPEGFAPDFAPAPQAHTLKLTALV